VGTYQSLHGRSLYLSDAKAAVKCIHRWYCALVGKKAMQSKPNQDCFFSRVKGWKGCNLLSEPFEIFPLFKRVHTASFFIPDIVEGGGSN